jgi:formylglycine-generating enzyme required for sulfatase activity
MEDGGYRNPLLWHSEAWAWLNENHIDAPLYWERSGDGYSYYTLDGRKPLAVNSPVAHISFYEASAFAEWAGMRLPTEFEWEAASGKLNWGKRWEWTNSAYLPYPRYQKADGAIGEYNGKFMINQMVLRGASVATSENHSRKTYRNFFSPSARWQFSGVRLVEK